MEKQSKQVLLLLLLISLLGCRKWVQVPVPKDRVVASRVFESEAKAVSALTAVYGNIINGSASFANASATLYAGLSADELLRFSPPAAETELMENTLSPQNAGTAALWKSAYQVIYQASAIIEGLEASTSLSAAVKERLGGEARFVRAFGYFYLVNFFGDVPLLTGTAFTVNAAAPRAPAADLLRFIIVELKTAKDHLPETYPGGDKGRPNRWAATALLARALLYAGDWGGAESEASAVIAAGLYTPLQSLSTVFLKNSREAIWQLSPANGLLRETSVLRPSGTPPAPQYYLPASLLAAFEPGDARRSRWLDSLTYLSVRYYYPGKYKNTAATVTEYYTVLRLAELYLVRAEARLNGGRLSEAVADINLVRNRAGLPSLLPSITRSQVVAALEAERRVELLAEWGHRWFDLKRWGRADAVLQPIKPRWQPTAVLYPVPQDEIDLNPALTQNPGY